MTIYTIFFSNSTKNYSKESVFCYFESIFIKNLAKLITLYEDDVFNLKRIERIKEEEKISLQILNDWAKKLPERKDDKNE